MSLLDDVRTKLLADGVGHATTCPVFVGYLPDDSSVPDSAIGLAPSGGLPQDTLGRENTLGSFQVKIRAARQDYDSCIAKWQDAFDSLQDAETALGVSMIQAMNSEPLVWYDQKNRPCAALNMRFIRARP